MQWLHLPPAGLLAHIHRSTQSAQRAKQASGTAAGHWHQPLVTPSPLCLLSVHTLHSITAVPCRPAPSGSPSHTCMHTQPSTPCAWQRKLLPMYHAWQWVVHRKRWRVVLDHMQTKAPRRGRGAAQNHSRKVSASCVPPQAPPSPRLTTSCLAACRSVPLPRHLR